MTLPLAAAPLLAMVLLVFLPESPVFLFKTGNAERGRAALYFFRGDEHDIEPEIEEINNYNKEEGDAAFLQKFLTGANVKAFLMLIGLHAFQQLSGINSVMFYAEKIFSLSGKGAGCATVLSGGF